MNPKAYLKRYRLAWFEITRRKKEIEDLKQILMLGSVDYTKERVQSSPKDTMAQIMSTAVDLEAKLNDEIEELMKIRDEVVSVINKVSDERLKTILSLRYISGETWESIAEALDLTSRWVQMLHGDALQEVRKIIENDTVHGNSY